MQSEPGDLPDSPTRMLRLPQAGLGGGKRTVSRLFREVAKEEPTGAEDGSQAEELPFTSPGWRGGSWVEKVKLREHLVGSKTLRTNDHALERSCCQLIHI